MPTVDLGTVRAFVDDGRIDVFLPRGYDGVVAAIKEMKGRWNPDRRCWSLVPAYARRDNESIVARLREVLLRSAPDGWTEVVDRFGGFACASRKYEVKVGDGGVRITLPEGHPSHWPLRQIEGVHRDGQTWLLPATSIAAPVIRPLLERIVREDRELFMSHVEHLETRSIRGVVPGTPEDGARIGLEPGGFVHANHAFLKVADPQVRNAPIHAWPLRVLSVEPAEGGLDVRLAYPDPELAYKAARFRQAQPEEDRRPLLDLPHATGKWAFKRL